MKTKVLLLISLLVICAFAPTTANALNNNVEVSLGIGSGDLTFVGVSETVDTESTELNLNFTHYFQDIETNNSPYGARVFLQHPSQIGIGLFSYDFEATDNLGDTLETNVDYIGFGGFYYTQSKENATGLGITHLSQELEQIITVGGTPIFSTKTDYKITNLFLHQYLSKSARLELGYSMSENDMDGISYDGTLISIGATGLIDNIWLSGYYQTGESDWPAGYTDNDIGGLGIQMGVYVNQKTGLFFSYDSITVDDGTSEAEVTNVSFAGDLYIDEKTHLKGALTLHEEDYESMIIKETILTLGAGFYF